MPKKKGSGTAITWSAFKVAPVSWAAFYTGKALNRIGFGLEKLGARIMAWAVSRLAKKARVK